MKMNYVPENLAIWSKPVSIETQNISVVEYIVIIVVIIMSV